MRRDSYYITLKHQWIGIDISPTACRVMAKRLTVQEILDEHIAKKLAWIYEKKPPISYLAERFRFSFRISSNWGLFAETRNGMESR